jgi:anthranilate/para-aminobenzoate synthase component I
MFALTWPFRPPEINGYADQVRQMSFARRTRARSRWRSPRASMGPFPAGIDVRPAELLAHLADRSYPVRTSFLGTTLVAADPSEIVCGPAVWEVLRRSPQRDVMGLAGAWMGFLGYDLALGAGTLAPACADPGGPPSAVLCRYDTVAQIAADGTCVVWGSGRPAHELVEMARDFARVRALGRLPDDVALPTSSLGRGAYEARVAEIGGRIRAGDFSQVNLAQRLAGAWARSPLEFANRLWAAAGPSSHAAYLGLPEGTLISASPEQLLRVCGGIATSFPIKGTAPVGRGAALAANTKDRAEHVMIVDLVRNDLGRVARPGGVSVTGLMAPLSTGYVEHLVSEIRAELADGVTPGDVLGAVFPAGSITGCPKIASMQVISELEPVARGAAFGSMIAVAPDGSLDASVLIRTAWLHGESAWYWSGGAVTWDSVPADEHAEAMAKARPFVEALGCA